METQVIFLNVVISEKNQEETQEKIQNASVP